MSRQSIIANMTQRKPVLLTGAGFTKNFGGPLTNEVWSQLFNNPHIHGDRKLQKLLLRKNLQFNFELIFTYLKSRGGKEFEVYSAALRDVFSDLDGTIRNSKNQTLHDIDLAALRKWLFRFAGNKKRPGFIFTLNQDLFFERHSGDYFVPHLPGIPPEAQALRVSATPTLTDVPIPNHGKWVELQPLLQPFNLIKLHGSCNWITSDRAGFMIIGEAKEKPHEIMRSQFLNSYFKLFLDVLKAPNTDLWIVGYGFNDYHINDTIEEAIKSSKSLRIYVVDPIDPERLFTSLKTKKFNSCRLRDEIRGHFPRTLEQLFRKGRGPTTAFKAMDRLFVRQTAQ